MNRLNHKLRKALTEYMRFKKKYLESQDVIAEGGYRVTTRIAYEWCAIAESIRKGYKKVKE